MSEISVVLECLKRSAAEQRQLHIVYEKPGEPSLERCVEPYGLTQGKNNLLIRAFQLSPEDGWRFFMLERIKDAKVGDTFIPRRKISINTGEIRSYADSTLKRNVSNADVYRDMVLTAIGDKEISDAEYSELSVLRKTSKLSPEQIRAVHYEIFHLALGTMLTDDRIEDDEWQQLNRLNTLLTKCGGGILE